MPGVCATSVVVHGRPNEELLAAEANVEGTIRSVARQGGTDVAGKTGKPISFKPSDKTYAELQAERREHDWISRLCTKKPLTPKDAANVALMAKEALEAGGSGPVLSLAGGLVKSYEVVEGVVGDVILGAKQNEALIRDGVRGALAGKLEGLPQGFRDTQKFERSGKSNAEFRAGLSLAENRRVMGGLQLFCDHGMTAALTLVRCGEDPMKILADPALKEWKQQYEKNMPFRMGFDAVVWARHQSDGPRLLADLESSLASRDARYVQKTEVKG